MKSLGQRRWSCFGNWLFVKPSAQSSLFGENGSFLIRETPLGGEPAGEARNKALPQLIMKCALTFNLPVSPWNDPGPSRALLVPHLKDRSPPLRDAVPQAATRCRCFYGEVCAGLCGFPPPQTLTGAWRGTVRTGDPSLHLSVAKCAPHWGPPPTGLL